MVIETRSNKDATDKATDKASGQSWTRHPHSWQRGFPCYRLALGIHSRQSTPQPERALPVAAPTVMTPSFTLRPKFRPEAKGGGTGVGRQEMRRQSLPLIERKEMLAESASQLNHQQHPYAKLRRFCLPSPDVHIHAVYIHEA